MNKKFIFLPILAAFAGVLTYLALSEKPAPKKPQEPALPYPYYTEDVHFEDKQAGIILAGTLTMPAKSGNFPAVVLVTGGGPQRRDAAFYDHKPFLVIADYLTKKGIAVLRYDDRGMGQSGGDFASATTLDFANDAESAIAYLKTRKEINPEKTGIAGHSEGSLVAAIVASRSKDVHFIISLAGVGVESIEAMHLQTELIARAGGVSEPDIALMNKNGREMTEILRSTSDTTRLRAELTAYAKANMQSFPEKMLPPGQSREQFIAYQIKMMCGPWFQFLYQADPATYFEKITCPVLALNGTKDLQVDAQQNLPAIFNAVKKGGNARVTVKELPGLNHFFQTSKTGHPGEYEGNQETFSPEALRIMSDWIIAQTK